MPGVVVPIPTFPPNVAKPEALNVVVVALVATRLLIQAVSETVRLVEEALVKTALVEKKVGAVSIDVEAFTKLVWPETVSAPPKYTLPDE